MKRKIRLTVNGDVSSKLHFVKLIKFSTRLGVRESKDICDHLCSNIGKTVEIEIYDELEVKDGEFYKTIPYLMENLPRCGDISFNGGKDYQREIKILSLGIGENEDYYRVIEEYLNLNNSFINNILSKLKREDLQELINEIEK